ncbi:hypothetical protein AAGS40_30120 (plasmid) [Paraburkholderia sp. PREW-6R]|uniref:hypothetical protein n=1 Tax=Paraburkholderia sp. PREW-6R TaxID=3141544 RepID=UPI0031F4DF22
MKAFTISGKPESTNLAPHANADEMTAFLQQHVAQLMSPGFRTAADVPAVRESERPGLIHDPATRRSNAVFHVPLMRLRVRPDHWHAACGRIYRNMVYEFIMLLPEPISLEEAGGYWHTLSQRRAQFATGPRPRRLEMADWTGSPAIRRCARGQHENARRRNAMERRACNAQACTRAP